MSTHTERATQVLDLLKNLSAIGPKEALAMAALLTVMLAKRQRFTIDGMLAQMVAAWHDYDDLFPNGPPEDKDVS